MNKVHIRKPIYTDRPNTENLLRIKYLHDSIIIPKIIHNIDSEAYTDDSIFTEINKLNFN